MINEFVIRVVRGRLTRRAHDPGNEQLRALRAAVGAAVATRLLAHSDMPLQLSCEPRAHN
eukprot:226000-Pleurochrysis_carterae.AAC.2